MNCRDFDQVWNKLLDAESPGRRDAPASPDDRDAAVRAHAGTCPSCALRHRQFEALRAALRAWSDRPGPAAVPPQIAERTLSAVAAPEPAPAIPLADHRLGRRFGIAALIAASAAAVFLAVRGDRDGDEGGRPEVQRRNSLRVAVADVRDASWRLARTASEPAAGIGLAMLDASLSVDAPTDVAAGTAVGAIPTFDAPAWLDQVGGYAAAGARPLSNAARQALGVLRSPSSPKSDRPDVSPAASKGA